jgi:RNA polymerase sigma factor (sigma-70 family)
MPVRAPELTIRIDHVANITGVLASLVASALFWFLVHRLRPKSLIPPEISRHHREARTTINGGVLRLLAPLEFSDDCCVGGMLAGNANTRDHERDSASTDICCNATAPVAHRQPNGCHSSWRQSRHEEEPVMTDQNTAELVRRAAAGDELAWRQLIDGLGPSLRRVSSGYRLGEAEAADAVATVWLKLVENIGSLRDGNSVPGWLMTTLRGECLARASARSRERPVADFAGVDEPVDVIDFDRWLADADRRQMVHRAMMKLSEQQRQLIGMLFADPTPSYAEISADLAIPIGSIGPTRCRLLGKLRDAIANGEGRELVTAG